MIKKKRERRDAAIIRTGWYFQKETGTRRAFLDNVLLLYPPQDKHCMKLSSSNAAKLAAPVPMGEPENHIPKVHPTTFPNTFSGLDTESK